MATINGNADVPLGVECAWPAFIGVRPAAVPFSTPFAVRIAQARRRWRTLFQPRRIESPAR